MEVYYGSLIRSTLLRSSRSEDIEILGSLSLRLVYRNNKLIEGVLPRCHVRKENGMATIVGTKFMEIYLQFNKLGSLARSRFLRERKKIFLDVTFARHAVRTDALWLVDERPSETF